MRCFVGGFRRWLRGLGALGDSGAEPVAPFERASDRPAMRSCVPRMPTSRSLKRPGLLVESSRVPGWPVSTCGSAGVGVTMSAQLATEFVNQKHP